MALGSRGLAMHIDAVRSRTVGDFVGRSVTFSLGKTGKLRELFAFVPAEFTADINPREDVFLPALVIAALVNGEDLDLDGMKIDPLLLRNCLAAARDRKST